MTTYVVDTNVAIAANGRDTHADLRCQRASIDWLEYLAAQGVVAVDEAGEILDEYSGYLRHSGGPGMGDAFCRHLFNNLHQVGRVHRVQVTRSDDDRRGFEELPVNHFDRSDRKFLAVAVVAKAVVLNATDSDWAEHNALMKKLDVKVDQICPQHSSRGA